MGGDALAATAQAAPFHPLNLLALLAPLRQSLGFLAACTFLLAALGTFLYVRELSSTSIAGEETIGGETAALVGAVAFAFSGFLVSWLGWPMGLAAAHLPWVFLAVRRLVSRDVQPSVTALLLALVLASSLHAGHPETASHLVFAGGAYGLFELFVQRPRNGSRREAWTWAVRKTAIATLGGLLAALLAAISLLPILDALPQTAQFEGRRIAFADADHSVPMREAFGRARTAAIPFVYGLPWAEAAPTAGYFVPTSSAYVGSAVFGLVLLGLFGHPWPGRWLLAFFAAFGIGAGASAPGVTHLLAHLPLLDISIHKRWVMLAAFALAILAALGASTFASRSGRSDRKPTLRVLLAHAVPLITVLGLLLISSHRLRTSEFSREFLLWNLGWLLLPPLLVATLHISGRRSGGPFRFWLLPSILILLIAQRAGEAGDRYPALDPQLAYPPIPILQTILEIQASPQASPWRFVATGERMPPNLGSLYDLEDVRGYQPMALGTYVRSFGLWTAGGDAYFHRVEDLERPFLDLLGVRWALDASPESGAPARVPSGWRSLTDDGRYRLLENLEALPRAFLPRRVRQVDRLRDPSHLRKGAADALATIEDRPYDGGLFPRPDRIDPDGRGREFQQSPGEVEILSWGYRPRLRVELETEAWVVITEPAWRGWRARASSGPLTGQQLPLHRANLTFLALHLPVGEHGIELEYRPLSFVLGLILTLGTLLVLAMLLARAGIRNRSRQGRMGSTL